jgi:hypothetical protein
MIISFVLRLWFVFVGASLSAGPVQSEEHARGAICFNLSPPALREVDDNPSVLVQEVFDGRRVFGNPISGRHLWLGHFFGVALYHPEGARSGMGL